MPDEIKRLQNELVCIYQADKDCGAAFEDSEIIAAYEAAIKALEKQTPKKLVQQGYYPSCCPSCGEYLDDELFFITDINYCPVCGQAFDWSEVEE